MKTNASICCELTSILPSSFSPPKSVLSDRRYNGDGADTFIKSLTLQCNENVRIVQRQSIPIMSATRSENKNKRFLVFDSPISFLHNKSVRSKTSCIKSRIKRPDDVCRTRVFSKLIAPSEHGFFDLILHRRLTGKTDW